MKLPTLSEAQIQRSVILHLEANASPGVIWFAVPNGGYRNLVEAARFKKQGVRAGVPDLCFVLPNGGRAAFLELKKPKGRVSPDQLVFRQMALDTGALWGIAYGIDEAVKILSDWGVLKVRAAA